MLVINDCIYYYLQMIYKLEAFNFFKINKVEINSALDIGAHKGKWTLEFKKHYPNAKVMMIEGNNRHIDDLQNIDPYIIALVGSYNGEIDYYICDDKNNDQGSGIYKENTNVPFTSFKRKIYTLDRLLGNQRFDIIKIDVQGAELDIIQGSPGFIHDTKYLWLELQPHNYNIGAPSAGKVIGYLNQIGFEIVAVDEINSGNGMIMGIDMIFVNVRNKDLKTGYNINQKVIWSGYSQ